MKSERSKLKWTFGNLWKYTKQLRIKGGQTNLSAHRERIR